MYFVKVSYLTPQPEYGSAEPSDLSKLAGYYATALTIKYLSECVKSCSPIKMPPGKLFLNIASGFERLHSFDHLEVGYLLKIGVFWGMIVFFGYHNTLFE